ncbi:MAG: prepilin-type N-terminal cleavage/methylation domain-containing protein [Burkholderiales bacterium]
MRRRGFTLMELVLVMLVLALLASLVAPVVTGGIQRARESTLKEDLYALRKAIDDYHADTGAYPPELEELVKRRYLRRIPPDPLTEKRDTWVVLRSEEAAGGKDKGIVDVRSGSQERASDGSYVKDW